MRKIRPHEHVIAGVVGAAAIISTASAILFAGANEAAEPSLKGPLVLAANSALAQQLENLSAPANDVKPAAFTIR